MSPVLPLDIIALIIDNVQKNRDIDLLKKLALVSYSFLHICRKHLFATVTLQNRHDAHWHVFLKKAFIKLLEIRPDVVKFIRELYKKYDGLLSPILLQNLLPTFSRLNILVITSPSLSDRDCIPWNKPDSSLTSALLHLMHPPTINHIDLSNIQNFPLSSLVLSVNLLQLDIDFLCLLEKGYSPQI